MLAAAEIEERLRTDVPFFARNCLKIIDKDDQMVPFEMSRGQLALDAKLEEQRAAGKPMRAIVLKARQVGISTYVQARVIQRTTQRENTRTIVVAHDVETGSKLFDMGRLMYEELPDDIRPALAATRRGRELRFENRSRYYVDTAGEFQGGRGGTYSMAHLSELAFWPNILTKLNGLKNAVASRPDTLVLIESTAYGHNAFKDQWDQAVAGASGYVPFFWPWWKEEQYSLPFANEDERAEFRIGDTNQSRYASGEERLVEPGPMDFETNERVPLSLEQLHWRRATIADECSGSFESWDQEYPTEPEDAFVASARQVFDPTLVRGVILGTALTDPRQPSEEFPGPMRGRLTAKAGVARVTRNGEGTISVPSETLWTPADKLTLGQQADWKFFIPPDKKQEQYVIGCDVSGGEISGDRAEPAYHAVQVLDHVTQEQVAEYRSRVDPDLLAEQIYLAALIFNNPWVGIEITGGWGLPVARRLWLDYKYRYLYFQRKPDKKSATKTEDRLGWDTNRKTKPIMEAGMAEALRDGTHGIKSFTLAQELNTYVRDENGRSGPEPGKFSDLLLAYMQAKQIAIETPIRKFARATNLQPRNEATGW